MKEILEKGPTEATVVEAFQAAVAQLRAAKILLDDYQQKFNAIFATFLALLRQAGGSLYLDKQFVSPVHVGEYTIQVVDLVDRIEYKLEHFTDAREDEPRATE